MMRLIIIGIMWIIAFFKSDWKRWQDYHATILFIIAADFYVSLITYNYTLWDLSSELGGHLLNDTLLAVLFFPPVILLYFTYYPKHKGIFRKVLYLMLWVLLFTGIEIAEYYLDNINYDNNWGIMESLFLNIALFIALTVHPARPFFAYFLFLLYVILLITICQIPVSGFK
ncbi:CBO0543 family protein [Fictibacillus barbaricus]|uniref:GGDEF domain-containing protein n=2 Tax=Fictibacillus barbaricus TaxID=182136 RepID=A0ABS2ZB29_9BACL|nr:CBO0543 family protein [Fictibacillus barbaricus]MBN3545115.1 hypothetical protein [Fictibacillus barbaricus]